MEKINIDCNKVQPFQYGLRGNDHSFSFVNKAKPAKNTVRQAGYPDTCRESLCSRVSSCLLYGYDSETDMSQLRLIVYVGKPVNESLAKFKLRIKKNINHSASLLRILEREARWKKTRVYEGVLKEEFEDNLVAFYLEGPKNWIMAPPYTSLYALILRTGAYLPELKRGMGFTEVLNEIKKISSKKADINDLKRAFTKMPALLTKQKEILKGLSKESIFGSAYQGIRLALSAHGNSILSLRVKEVLNA